MVNEGAPGESTRYLEVPPPDPPVWPPMRGAHGKGPKLRGEQIGDRAPAVLTLLEALTQATDIESFRREALAVADLIPGEIVSFNEVCESSGAIVMVAREPGQISPEVIDAYLSACCEHPVIAHHARTGELRPAAISELVSERAFRATRLYQEIYRDLGIGDQLVIPIPHPVATVSVDIGRASWGFSKQELALARLVQRVLTVAYARQREHEAIRVSSQLMWKQAECDGQQILLADHYGDLVRPDGTPATIDRRVQLAIRHAVGLALECPDPGSPGDALVEIPVRSGDGQRIELRVLAPPPGSDLLPVVIKQPTVRPQPADLQRHGLTPRQADVMALIMQAETNAGIANELGISTKTVEKHIEAAYRRLGVQTRTEALVALMRGDAD